MNPYTAPGADAQTESGEVSDIPWQRSGAQKIPGLLTTVWMLLSRPKDFVNALRVNPSGGLTFMLVWGYLIGLIEILTGRGGTIYFDIESTQALALLSGPLEAVVNAAVFTCQHGFGTLIFAVLIHFWMNKLVGVERDNTFTIATVGYVSGALSSLYLVPLIFPYEGHLILTLFMFHWGVLSWMLSQCHELSLESALQVFALPILLLLLLSIGTDFSVKVNQYAPIAL